jgi:hypothetical protein
MSPYRRGNPKGGLNHGQPEPTSNCNQTPERRDYRKEVTESIIQMLQQGVAPWQKPWDAV